ncbi:ATP-dependent DNA helicase DinG [Serratia symbiotica]|uniref:ATP-dependent DNA helicase DinG n=1 Tax=Serratia symbiotica TaxID=138074 RepID=A0A068Z1F4_9GAMM|nr:ATP-dependent DNA helicase DinG [Serratia symbiotica]MBF1995270.1 ATP-dependent DNA helicase DinG [Serratia symbiotica]MBQ0956123.1 ATP-dependent DNA helicase DinG [Serratia symbiotica]QLH63023.1 ATP-dependent DNA helicase DinG [Serratia symbiotica]QTP15310.1 ATP-dependent DNA helicase DinG [Serratia symbiotica]CDS57351.1 ATP-dependent DNA helicase [Serratia symbiotica]
MSLSCAIKHQIGQWYKALQQQIPDFISRTSQRQMIAEVAKTLAGDSPRHLAIEAPTGVGKTLSYLIPGIAVGRAEGKPLVVSTANVALQDQIYSKDLPLLKKIIPDLKFTGAFGRGRYLCPRNLAAISSDTREQGDLPLFLDDERGSSSGAELALCQKLGKAFSCCEWDGLRDHYSLSIDDPLWARLSTDKANCLGRNCHYIRECPFYIARKEIESADVVVTNHALVMAALETESVLPNPKALLLVLDEGHHLPDVARDALEISGEITALSANLQLDMLVRQVEQCMSQYRPKNPPGLANSARLNHHCETLREQVQLFERQVSAYLPSDSVVAEHRFEMGALPTEMMENCVRLFNLTDALRGLTGFVLNALTEQTGKHDIIALQRSVIQLSRTLGYLEAMSKLWHLAALDNCSNAPISKWVTRDQRDNVSHLYLHCVGIRVSEQLEKLLWRKVPHVVITSATLRSLNSFARLQEMSGLNEQAGDRFMTLASPFNHVAQGKIIIPQMRFEPVIATEAQHLEEMARFFRAEQASGQHQGMLILFSSHRAMQTFLGYVTDLRLTLLVQGDQPRYRLVEEHCKRVEKGIASVLVGLQSFAEGLDLKGELLTQVHIHKIAFPPIDSPVIVTEAEWLKSLKRYPFEVQSLPSASFNLIQQVGRLIRSNQCHGEIVIYDRRLLTKGYGARLLAALPVFPIEQRALPEADKAYLAALKSAAAAAQKEKKRRHKR